MKKTYISPVIDICHTTARTSLLEHSWYEVDAKPRDKDYYSIQEDELEEATMLELNKAQEDDFYHLGLW